MPFRILKNNFLLLLLFLGFSIGFSFQSFSQNPSRDLKLIEKQDFHKKEFDKRKVSPLLIGKNVFTRYNPVSLVFTGLMFGYQKMISPQLSAGCSYEISCSAFSKKCINEYGLLKGVALSADRLTRCNQVAAYDIHPMNITPEQKIHDPLEKYHWHGKQK